jgi:tRNA pseudouridine13 synthase
MKLRQEPEDFKVEELADFEISESPKEFRIYALEKKGMETFYLLSYLSKSNKVPVREIGIAGLKDKHAITKQFLSIPSKYEIKSLSEKNFSLTFLGFADSGISQGQLFGNRFFITVRDLREKDFDKVDEQVQNIRYGVPNYFDSQRFGSVIYKQFIAKHIIQKNYEGAVKIFLTTFTRHENSRIKGEKKEILSNWGNFGKLRITTNSLIRVVKEYNKNKSWLKAYQAIPYNLREMFCSAYQSYLWNECVKKIVLEKIPPTQIIKVAYQVGELAFFNGNAIFPKTFPTISHDMQASDYEKKIVAAVLGKEGVRLESFDIKDATGNYFKTYSREFITVPKDFVMSNPSKDLLNPGRYKVSVVFTLGKGSYATIITKRIFGQ